MNDSEKRRNSFAETFLPDKPIRLKYFSITICIALLVELLVVCLPMVTFFAVPVITIALLYWMLVSLLRKRFFQLKGYAMAMLIMWAMTALTIYGHKLDNDLAQERASMVSAALEAYYEDNGRYPQELPELVPQYMDEVPHAKYCLACGMTMKPYHGFSYWYYPDDFDYPTFFYVVWPPFGHNNWSFASKKWHFRG